MPRTVPMTQFFEDITMDEVLELGNHRFTDAAIIDFARQFDPQRFHVDAEAAKATLFGGLIASGWQTAAIWMKLMVAHALAEQRAALARGETPARIGPSPGFRDMQWLAPVRPGDTLTYRSRISGKEDWPKRPNWGLLLTTNTAHNAAGLLVFQFTAMVLVERRLPPPPTQAQP